jgi:phospho-N-acetylmuramoyl-pentapeptide-transferase
MARSGRSFFNVFNYITLRTVLATMTALLISFAAGPRVIRWLAEKKIGQAVRNDGPQTHLVKSGTPTMGGVLILISIGITTLLWGDLTNKYVWTVLVVTLGFGIVGWYDDWKKVVYRDPKGLSAGWKYFWQSVLGLGAALFLAYSAKSGAQTELIVPFFKTIAYPLGIIGFITLTYFRHRRHQQRGQPDRWPRRPGDHADRDDRRRLRHLRLRYRPCRAGQISVHPLRAGRWRIVHPARGDCRGRAGLPVVQRLSGEVFMGDVGALSLGAALGTVAVILRQEIVLLIMGGVFVVETLSVMLQVGYFKYTKKKFGEGRRILRMAPLHHHFEQTGWKETQVVVRFWIITIMLVLVGLSSLKLR